MKIISRTQWSACISIILQMVVFMKNKWSSTTFLLQVSQNHHNIYLYKTIFVYKSSRDEKRLAVTVAW